MSHILKVAVKLDNKDALLAACARLGLKAEDGKQHKVFSRSIDGVKIQLPGWNYPVVIDAKGEAQYDNYNGGWGAQEKLDELCQIYSAEVLTQQANEERYTTQEEVLENGDIRLVMTSYA